MYVINDIVGLCSDHFPLCLNIDCDMPPIYNETVANIQRNVHKWQLANDINLQEYELNTHIPISRVVERSEFNRQKSFRFYENNQK